jgi:hypothetical protein
LAVVLLLLAASMRTRSAVVPWLLWMVVAYAWSRGALDGAAERGELAQQVGLLLEPPAQERAQGQALGLGLGRVAGPDVVLESDTDGVGFHGLPSGSRVVEQA